MNQESNDQATQAPLQLSRWGVYHFQPEEGSTPLDKKLLAITITDESEGGGTAEYKGFDFWGDPDVVAARDEAGEAKFLKDKKLETFTSELGITAEIAVVVTPTVHSMETLDSGDVDLDGGEVVPNGYNETTDLADFAKVYRGMGRETFNSSGVYGFLGGTLGDAINEIPADKRASSSQADFLYEKFLEMTDDGENLPDALGIFVDNSGSQLFSHVNDAVFSFIDTVKENFPSVILPSDNLISGDDPISIDLATDPNGENIGSGETGVFRGISLAGAEDWIHQSQMALENLINTDPTFQDALITKTEEPKLDLDEYTLNELSGFLDALIAARGQNAAEQQRILGEIAELSEKVVNLEKSIETGESLDFAAAMGVFHKTKDQVDLNAQLVAAAKDMENVLFTDFL